jgi:hypothetical protein
MVGNVTFCRGAEVAGRAHRRGDSTGPVAGRTPARAGSHWAAFPDVATRIASRGEDLSHRGADFAGEAGSLALEPRAERGGSGILTTPAAQPQQAR